MSFRDQTLGDPQGATERDQSYKKVIPNNDLPIPDIGKGRMYFRIVSMEPSHFFHGMEFWLNLGYNATKQKMNTIPKISPNPFSDFIVQGQNGKYISRSAALHGCPLSKLADNRHPLIALNTKSKDKNGNCKPNVNPFHAAMIQRVEPVRNADGKVVMDAKGAPTVKVHPEAYIFKFRQAWWAQFLDIVEPQASNNNAMDDGMTDAPVAQTKTLPTTDLTKVVWFVEKQRRTKNPTGDPATDVDYVVSFSEKIVLDPAQIPVVTEPLDFAKVFKAPTDMELAELIAKAEVAAGTRQPAGVSSGSPLSGGGAPNPDAPGAWGAQVPRPGEQVPMPAGAGTLASGASTGASDEPF